MLLAVMKNAKRIRKVMIGESIMRKRAGEKKTSEKKTKKLNICRQLRENFGRTEREDTNNGEGDVETEVGRIKG